MPPRQNPASIVFRSLVVVLLLGLGVGVAYWLFSTSPVPPSSVRPDTRRTVDVVEVSPVPVLRPWIGYGLSSAEVSEDVPAEVSSIVTVLPPGIKPGNPVSKGELLARLDEGDFRRQYEIAERSINEIAARFDQLDIEERSARRMVELGQQDVEIVKDELKRIESARDEGAANPREVDLVRQRLVQSETALTSAQSMLDGVPVTRRLLDNQKAAQVASRDLALRNLERCTIRSAIDGVLEVVDIELGERVGPGQRLARVVNLSKMVVEIRLPVSARDSVSIGNDVELTARGASERHWSGSVSRISPVDDPANRTMGVYVDIDQSPAPAAGAQLVPGTFLQATVNSTYPVPRLMLPSTSVKNDRIWLVDDDSEIISLPVEVAFPIELPGGDGTRFLVLEGDLPTGSRVLVHAEQSPSIGTEVDYNVIDPAAGRDEGAGS
ncbi:MAG: HlyD family efflux transporter periplasmic adaptor subunit [Planctomycetota bacterium]|nr:HlyD family efflux transporter periplasmic adaptor subunit [Planctomycetota bacterium]MEC9157943.1 HlyD family efflux transporter periplasmic adaptor subunit [Planctomycetota bacterium]MEC9232422.1 HlyD family efflux transporter periplasmic adaptor subunit [Planctomycetota bacterium]